jgi:hypothetical protein
LRILLWDPVSSLRNANPDNVLGNLAHHLLDERSRRTGSAAHSQDWERELSVTARSHAIVFCVSVESAIYLETSAHRSRSGIISPLSVAPLFETARLACVVAVRSALWTAASSNQSHALPQVTV